jgi:hypothetical protein
MRKTIFSKRELTKSLGSIIVTMFQTRTTSLKFRDFSSKGLAWEELRNALLAPKYPNNDIGINKEIE